MLSIWSVAIVYYLSLSFSLVHSFVGRGRCFFSCCFFSCVCSFFFLFCFSLHSISICPFAMVYLGHGFFFFSCTDDFLLGGDLCASKCRLCLTPLVCVSWNGKAFWVDGWTLKVKSGSVLFFFVMVIFLWWALFYPTKVRGGKVYWQMWQHQSFVCLFWPEIARVESWSRGMMVYCFFAASVHGRVDTWRQLQLFTYLGEWSASTSRSGLIFVLGGREDNKSTYPWIPIRTFLNAAKVFFLFAPLYWCWDSETEGDLAYVYNFS